MRKSIRFLLISIICLLAFASTGSNQGLLKGFQIIGVKGAEMAKIESVMRFSGKAIKASKILKEIERVGLTQSNSVLASVIANAGKEKISLKDVIVPLSGKTIRLEEWEILPKCFGLKSTEDKTEQSTQANHESTNKPVFCSSSLNSVASLRLDGKSLHLEQIYQGPRSPEQIVEVAHPLSLMQEKSMVLNISASPGGNVEAFFVDTKGQFQELEAPDAKNLKDLIKRTTQAEGLLSQKTSSDWESFFQPFLLEKEPFTCPDGVVIEKKTRFIIRSNEVNHKSLKLAEVPVLMDNFIPYIDLEYSRPFATYVDKIQRIPKLKKDKIGIVIRHPADLPKPQAEQWAEKAEKLKKLIGDENVLFDPSKDEFQRFLNDTPKRGKEVIIIEITHTQDGIILKDGIYTSADVLKCGDLSGITYLLTGIGSCSFPLLEKGAVVDAFRLKGVDIINATAREVPCEIALKRIDELIHILKNIEKYDIWADQLLKFINERLRQSGEKDADDEDWNIGKLPCCGDPETLTT